MDDTEDKFNFNMSYSAILRDIAQLLKEEDSFVGFIEQYGIDEFIDYCADNDIYTINEINQDFNSDKEVAYYNAQNNTNFSREGLIKYLKSIELALPHANYNHIEEIKAVLQSLYCDNPNLFQDLISKPYIDIHNELMTKYGVAKASTTI